MLKFVIFITVFLVANIFAVSLFDSTLDEKWTKFKIVNRKKYNSVHEEAIRRVIWESNHDYIERHNVEAKNGKHTFTVKMNKFGDLTNKEFRSIYNGFNNTRRTLTKKEGRKYVKPIDFKAPDSVDWREQGYVTEIKDQGQCGSCWAFSSVVALEGQHFKSSGDLVSLSEQNLVDCSQKFGNNGCNGGVMDQAFDYVKANKGIDTEDSYPYEAKDGECRFNPDNVGATDTGFVDVTSGDENELANAIATVGPISVAIDASQKSFQFYSTGIYSDDSCSSTELDHGVAVVGYGSQGDNQDFYIVRNSWGTGWGDQGYILIARNSNNMCGVATTASYPIV